MNTAKNRKPRILVLEGLAASANCIHRAGGEPVVVSPRNLAVLEAALLARFDGMLLTGGGDVDPRLYGEKPHPKVYGVSELRDYAEWVALDRAAELGVPVMGICRGHQLMTVHNGGRLRQHLGGHRGVDHPVFAESGSRFARIIGGDRAPFVSLHHQVVLRHGSGWRVAARDHRGNIEAVESVDGRCLGVQFHPEMDYGRNEPSRRLFDWLVRESAKRAGLPKPSRVKPKPAPKRQAKQHPVERVLPRRPLGGQMSLLPTPGKRGSRRGVTTRWVCRDCGLRFDKQQDRDDHEYWVCGTPELRVAEPPPGHPDWTGSRS